MMCFTPPPPFTPRRSQEGPIGRGSPRTSAMCLTPPVPGRGRPQEAADGRLGNRATVAGPGAKPKAAAASSSQAKMTQQFKEFCALMVDEANSGPLHADDVSRMNDKLRHAWQQVDAALEASATARCGPPGASPSPLLSAVSVLTDDAQSTVAPSDAASGVGNRLRPYATEMGSTPSQLLSAVSSLGDDEQRGVAASFAGGMGGRIRVHGRGTGATPSPLLSAVSTQIDEEQRSVAAKPDAGGVARHPTLSAMSAVVGDEQRNTEADAAAGGGPDRIQLSVAEMGIDVTLGEAVARAAGDLEVYEKKLRSKMAMVDPEDVDRIENALQSLHDWLLEHPFATQVECQEQQRDLESLVDPIMNKAIPEEDAYMGPPGGTGSVFSFSAPVGGREGSVLLHHVGFLDHAAPAITDMAKGRIDPNRRSLRDSRWTWK